MNRRFILNHKFNVCEHCSQNTGEAGFEPTICYHTLVFKTSSFSHSDTRPCAGVGFEPTCLDHESNEVPFLNPAKVRVTV